MKKEAILFDLDGTLVNSRQSIVKAVYETTEAYRPGLTTIEAIKSKFGAVYSDDLIAINPDQKEKILKVYNRKISDAYRNEVVAFPYVEEGLARLKQEGFRLGIVTNQTSKLTELILQKCNLMHFMECIITVDQVRAGKPDPEPIFAALSKLDLPPTAAMMVGDSMFDIAAADKAGVTSVLLDNYQLFEETEVPADITINHFEELIDTILQPSKNITT